MRFLLFLLTLVSLSYGVVSIAPVEIGKQPGFSGELEASFETTRGNTEKDEYKGALNLKYDNNTSYVTWAEFNANYAEASGVKNSNKTYAHLRYIHTFVDKRTINWESFLQSETNEFTKINERFLAGGGLRFHLLDASLGNAYIGTGAFYEHIDYSTQTDRSEDNLRLNLYISYDKDLTEDSQFALVGYYQPRVDAIDDYIVSSAAQLKVRVYEKLFLSFKVNYNYDSKPAVGVKKEDFSQLTSLIYKF